MNRKMKLNFDEIRIKSFVTNLESNQTQAVHGGLSDSVCQQTCGLCSGDTCHLGCSCNGCGGTDVICI